MWLLSQRTLSDIFVALRKRVNMQKIMSLEELKKVSAYNDKKPYAYFYILINSSMRSSKRIVYFPATNTFDLYNEIDDSFEDDLTEEQLLNETHIGIAIENGCLYKYDF